MLPSLKTWIANLFGGGRRAPIRNSHRRLFVRPRFEVLDERIAPSVSLDPVLDQHNVVGDMPAVILMATDSNSNPLEYSAVNLPAGLMLTNSTISGTIASGANLSSPYLVTATATDTVTLESDSHEFYWYVSQNLPTVTLMNPGNQSSHDGETPSLPLMGWDSAGNPLTYSAVNLPTGLTVNATTGVISGTVDAFADFYGPFDVTVTATDATAGVSANQLFTWTVSYAPFLDDQDLAVPHDQPITIDLSASVRNADPAQLQYTIVNNPMFGSVAPTGDGVNWIYTPPTHFVGTASIGFKANDGMTDSNTAVITIAVTDFVPVVAPMLYHVDQTGATVIPADQGLMQLVTDADDVPTIELIQQPENANVEIAPDGSFTFTPGNDFTGTASFVVAFHDGFNAIQDTVSLTTFGLIARDDTYRVVHDSVLSVDMESGLLANDDVPGGPGAAGIVITPTTNDATIFNAANGSFTLTPRAGFVGVYTFTYQFVVGTEVSNVATVRVEVTNNPPEAFPQSYRTTLNTPLVVNALNGVLWDAEDEDGDEIVVAPGRRVGQFGVWDLNQDGSFTYTPNFGVVGADVFEIRPKDGIVEGQSVRVQIEVGMPAPITISGTIKYDLQHVANPTHPVRDARVAVFSMQQRAVIAQGFTNDSGQYNLTLPNVFHVGNFMVPMQYAPNSLMVVALTESSFTTVGGDIKASRAVRVLDTGTTDLQQILRRFVDGNLLDASPFRVAARVPANNNTVDIKISKGSLAEKAFWTFDAAITARYLHVRLDGVPDGRASLFYYDPVVTAANAAQQIRNLPLARWSPLARRVAEEVELKGANGATSFTPPDFVNPLIRTVDFNDWDTIVHEYGHFVQHTSGFFPFTLQQYASLQAPARHSGSGNNRVEFSGYSPRIQDQLAFSEGWGEFYGVTAQQEDPLTPDGANAIVCHLTGAVSGDFFFGGSSEADIRTSPNPGLADPNDPDSGPNGASYGEDSEAGNARLLWDVAPMLGLQGLFDALTSPAGSVTTVSELWNKLTANATPARTVEFGTVFGHTDSNISPTGLTMQYVGFVPDNVFLQSEPKIPVFVWTIPQGQWNDPSTARLLNIFTVRVFNDEYTQELLLQPGLTVNDLTILSGDLQNPTVVSWRPSQDQWDAITADADAKHFVVSGLGLRSITYITGDYWSGAFDFSIVDA